MEDEYKMVKVYYCKCGKSIMKATHPSLLIGNTADARSLRKEFKQAAAWGRKVAEITIEEFRKTPFMQCDTTTKTDKDGYI